MVVIVIVVWQRDMELMALWNSELSGPTSIESSTFKLCM